jgi:hypothetical protein
MKSAPWLPVTRLPHTVQTYHAKDRAATKTWKHGKGSNSDLSPKKSNSGDPEVHEPHQKITVPGAFAAKIVC